MAKGLKIEFDDTTLQAAVRPHIEALERATRSPGIVTIQKHGDVIPKDAREVAIQTVRDFGADHGLLVGAIAGAIVMERNRCATILENTAKLLVNEWGTAETLEALADKIRKGDNP